MNLKQIVLVCISLISITSYINCGIIFKPVVTNTNDSGPGSLREAVKRSDENHGMVPNIINFKIPGNGPFTINLLSDIIIERSAEINGFSQPGASLGNELITITGGELKPQSSRIKIQGIKQVHQIYQPKTLREQAIANIAKQVRNRRLTLEQAELLIPSDLHDELNAAIRNAISQEIKDAPKNIPTS